MPIYKIIIERQEFEVLADNEDEALDEALSLVDIDNIVYIGEE